MFRDERGVLIWPKSKVTKFLAQSKYTAFVVFLIPVYSVFREGRPVSVGSLGLMCFAEDFGYRKQTVRILP